MRKILLLALFLYNIIAKAARVNSYDYEDVDGIKRQSLIDERRKWRKRALLNPIEDSRDWVRGRNDYDIRDPRYIMEEPDPKIFGGIDRPRDPRDNMDLSSQYRQAARHYEDDKMNLPQTLKSAEVGHAASYIEKEPEMEKKPPMAMNCERPHERYEVCFAGCASVTCDNPQDRLRPCYPFCEAGCICVHPYVRDDRTHKCVLPQDCTKGLKGIPDLGDEI